MSSKTPEILWPALRQHRHNTDNSASPTSPREGFVIAFEYDETVRVVMELEAQLAEARRALVLISTALDAYGVRWCRDVAKDALQEKGG